VSGIGPGQDDERIVSAVVDLAANLGLRSIAEGVQRKGQLDALRELGCDQAQGFLFARALPPEEIPALIQHEAW
jgi:EAL domain-containing protein (putative c-di-GMP-specific phosphodiesterase class I)